MFNDPKLFMKKDNYHSIDIFKSGGKKIKYSILRETLFKKL